MFRVAAPTSNIRDLGMTALKSLVRQAHTSSFTYNVVLLSYMRTFLPDEFIRHDICSRCGGFFQ